MDMRLGNEHPQINLRSVNRGRMRERLPKQDSPRPPRSFLSLRVYNKLALVIFMVGNEMNCVIRLSHTHHTFECTSIRSYLHNLKDDLLEDFEKIMW